jgi:hypothetical protein
MDKEKFMDLLTISDASFNIPNFSSGNSSKEAFAMGAPVVTCFGDFMRSWLATEY